MKSAFAAIFLLSLFLPDSSSSRQSSDPYLRLFENAYKRSRTLQADFLQQYSEGGRVTRSEAGVAYFRRPGKMRWEYRSPEENLFVVDGKFAWFYVPADRTVSRVSARQSADWRTPLALLAGEMKVSRVCSSVELASSQPKDAELVRLNCVIRGTENEAKSGKPHDSAFFDVRRANGQLSRVTINGAAGVRMEITFSNWRFDPPASGELFRFQPAKGIAIVDGDELLPGPSQHAR